MRKPAFCICENKNADQLRSNCAADQRLCFRYKDSAMWVYVIVRSSQPVSESIQYAEAWYAVFSIYVVCIYTFREFFSGSVEDFPLSVLKQ